MARAPHQSTLHARVLRGWTHRGLWAWSMWPLSLLYGLLARLRRWVYRSGWATQHRVDALVVIVGNVVAGGVGKTPIVIALAQHLRTQGWTIGVVSRGYGRATADCREVRTDGHADEFGDEPLLIRRSTGVPVFVASRRADAARALLAAYPSTQVILSDDGLQHHGLQRDIEICVFDDRGVGNGCLLPAGPLREPWPRPVDLVLHSGSRPAFAGFTAPRTLVGHAVRADGSQVALATLAGPGAKPLRAVAAIAQPEKFFAMLRSAGLVLAESVALPDHASFDDWDPPHDAHFTLLCTEKDAVKLWRRNPEALAVPLQVDIEPAFLSALERLLRARLPAKLSSLHGHTTT
ncbi:tetraacyldisaccharide 4'-kinase [Rhodoferax sp.]|uniref:tetraacyldisaccharide 4'-kinase n=1 Tax=Rhodoferax sp. TaxID=50421 RepID=UPI0027649AE2|nr:tetraacyldisaccharide 4'-kinase [Rhodoferax sp.]